jgi:hypothetical protein
MSSTNSAALSTACAAPRSSDRKPGQILSMDWIYGDPTTLVTFLQNHDVGPDNDFHVLDGPGKIGEDGLYLR